MKKMSRREKAICDDMGHMAYSVISQERDRYRKFVDWLIAGCTGMFNPEDDIEELILNKLTEMELLNK